MLEARAAHAPGVVHLVCRKPIHRRQRAMQLSSDGLLRLSIDELLSLPIAHLVSGVDSELSGACSVALRECGRETVISGYTEWVSTSSPAVSIGWDWQLQLSLAQQTLQWARLGQPRTNVMLVYAAGGDTGWIKNLELLATVVDALPWQDPLVRAVGLSPGLGVVDAPVGHCAVP